jgi:hydrogenase expression/formation protein HypE
MDEVIKLSHGEGGADTQDVIKNIFYRYFNEPHYNDLSDAYVFEAGQKKYSFTTDSFVVKPIFFRGGNIGKLAVCGTINDLVTAGAIPLYLSAGFIIEEGFPIEKLHLVAKTMGDVCKQTGVKIVTGDTKVVEKGSVDHLFINTTGIGLVSEHYNPKKIEPGDEIIITGGIAEHGTSILLDRYDFGIETDLVSDCTPLCNIIHGLRKKLRQVKLMKDPTRGGLATALNEIATMMGVDVEVDEQMIPVKSEVKSICDIIGMDPMYLASEGRMIIIVTKGYGEQIIQHIKELNYCNDTQIIGHFTSGNHGKVYMKTWIGGKRIIPVLEGQILPRIC